METPMRRTGSNLSDHTMRQSFSWGGASGTVAFAACGLAIVLLSSCASTTQEHAANDQSQPARHCVLDNRGRVRVCTTQPVPSMQADEEAKRGAGDSSSLTVYVVRHSWGDSRELLRLSVDADPAGIETTPNSLLRMRLAPGEHRLSFDHANQLRTTQVSGAAGEVRFLWIRREPWSFARELLWGVEPEAATRARVKQTRLVADIRLNDSARQ